ncbi:MAG: hypothetical protein U0168_08255 [Nannocystaceae bacterium]
MTLLALAACGGDDGGTTTSVGTTDPTTSTSTAGTSTSETTGGGSSTSAGSSSSEGGTSSSGGADSSSGGSTTGPLCDPPVQGEWNACKDADGTIDNTLCNWVGTGESVGMVSCLSASSNPDANVCFIRGCVDACDCFDPPATGTAVVVCDAILAGGEMGCGLDCSEGKTCPDGMECLDNLCFWVPA